jgi:amino acid adenylation domain-containing protein
MAEYFKTINSTMKINIIEFFTETVNGHRDKVAFIDGNNSITFEELNNNAKLIANKIINLCACFNSPIGVYLPKCIESVASDIAITYSGNAYMNLDIKTPLKRIGNIISLVKPRVIITNTNLKEKIESIISDSIFIINVDEYTENEVIPCNEYFLNRLSSLIDTDPYCIINTSGSTGTPKGVVLNHKSFIDFMAQTFDEFEFSGKDVIGSLSPIIFDIYSYELCLLMAKGAIMVVIPDSYSAFPIKILQLLQTHHVSYIFWVPTIMVNIANMNLLQQIQLPDLRLVWFAGEVFPTKQFNIWRINLPQTKFANFYGPIEITLDCVYYVIERNISDDEPIPIGKPFRNTSILILDKSNNLINEPNKEGELCVRGTSLAMGYYNNPEKTAVTFVQNPLNNSYPEIIYRTGDIVFINNLGEIVFKGREDSLVKHMGYRIELGEIEHIIINSLKLIKNGCVVYNHQRKEITLFYSADKELSPAEFRKAIGTSLQKYMMPVVYIKLDELQINTNGKIDRLYYNKQVNG